MIESVWSVMGGAMAAVAIVYCVYADTARLILPVMVLFAGIGVSITAYIINDGWMRFCGMMSFFMALFSFKETGDAEAGWYYDCFIFILCIVLMFIIPGHRLNWEARRTRKEAA